MRGTLIGLLTLCAAANATAQCLGDFDNDGAVEIGELITAVGNALGGCATPTPHATEQCLGDFDADGAVDISELITAVGNALRGCAPPTPIPDTPTATPTRPPTPSRTPTATACAATDFDGDGTLRIAVLGASNDAVYPADRTRWVTTVASEFTTALVGTTSEPVEWINEAVPGTQACANGVPPQGPAQLIAAVAAHADIIITALGTNDLFGGSTPPEILACVQMLETNAGGRQFFVALIPPVYPPAHDVGVDATNALFTSNFAHIIDFNAGFTADLYDSDGIHLTQAGEDRRASVAIAALQAQLCVSPTPTSTVTASTHAVRFDLLEDLSE